MVKRKTAKKSDDISNWAVVLMLVAVIVVSTLSIVLFMDAADGVVKSESQAVGAVSLEVVNPGMEPDNETVEEVEVVDDGAGEVSLEVQEEN